METVLISGINGFLGKHLAEYLHKLKYRVVGLVKSSDRSLTIDGENMVLYQSTDTGIKEAFNRYRFDCVIHTATIYRQRKSASELIETNIILPIKLLEYSNKMGVKSFINTDTFFNSASTKYEYLGNYTLSKRHCLEWLKTQAGECKLINMKIHHMYGPYDSDAKFVTNISRQMLDRVESLDLTECNQSRDFVYVLDVCSAFEAVIRNAAKFASYSEFDVGSGQSIKLSDFIETIKEISESTTELNYGKIPQRKGEPMYNIADISKLNRLGWYPKYNIETGIRSVLNAIKS